MASRKGDRPAETGPEDALGPLRVLVVEHDDADAELNVAALRRTGLTVHAETVKTRREFDERVVAEAWDVVLADFRMPGWSGLDVMDRLRELGSDAPFILVTGTVGEERAVECLQHGAADFVVKSNLKRLPVAVRRAVREKRARDDLARAEAQARNAELEVRDGEARFRQLAENINEVFFLVDAKFQETLYINAAYDTIWGQDRRVLYENPQAFVDALPPEDRVKVFENTVTLSRGEDPGEIEFRVNRPDGSMRWVVAHAIPVRNERGEVYRIAGVARDVTEERRSRIALTVSEGRFRALADASFDAIAVTRDGIVREANKGFLEMFGYATVAEVVGHHATHFLASESHAATLHRVQQQVEGRYELIGLRKDGKKLILEVTSRECDDGTGKLARVSALRDVTAQRALEAQYRQSQKLEAVGRLAGAVAHDFNNLLTVIGSYAEFLKAETPAGDARAEYVQEITRATSTAADLTRRLLAFSRQQLLQPRVVALDDVIANARGMLDRLIGEDVKLIVRSAPQPASVVIDPAQVEQVLLNLAVNSRDAMPTGGTLTIAREIADPESVVMRAHAGPGAPPFATIIVSDTGVGMTDEVKARIFEPFFTTKEPGKGTGLGLATVYAIATQAGGFIDVESEPGRGTSFTVYLPVASELATPERTPHPPERAREETILLVEDAAPVRHAVRGLLERLGYEVLEAADGRTALGYVALRRPIHLLLTDVILPEMNGREVAEQAKVQRPDLRVLYMSGYTDDAVLRHGIEVSSVAFLQKPFTVEVLAAKVRETLDAQPAP